MRRRIPRALATVGRWRRRSDAWVVLCLLASWFLLTLVTWSATGWGWPVWAASVGVYLLFFEVGLAHLRAAAWSSSRGLETEGRAVDRAVEMLDEQRSEETICRELGLSPEELVGIRRVRGGR